MTDPREKFEAFVRVWRPKANLATDGDGHYSSQAVQHQFEVWRESRMQAWRDFVAAQCKSQASVKPSPTPTKGPTP